MKTHGMTLVEMLIALAITGGLIFASAVVLRATFNNSSENILTIAISQDLRKVGDRIKSEVEPQTYAYMTSGGGRRASLVFYTGDGFDAERAGSGYGTWEGDAFTQVKASSVTPSTGFALLVNATGQTLPLDITAVNPDINGKHRLSHSCNGKPGFNRTKVFPVTVLDLAHGSELGSTYAQDGVYWNRGQGWQLMAKGIAEFELSYVYTSAGQASVKNPTTDDGFSANYPANYVMKNGVEYTLSYLGVEASKEKGGARRDYVDLIPLNKNGNYPVRSLEDCAVVISNPPGSGPETPPPAGAGALEVRVNFVDVLGAPVSMSAAMPLDITVTGTNTRQLVTSVSNLNYVDYTAPATVGVSPVSNAGMVFRYYNRIWQSIAFGSYTFSAGPVSFGGKTYTPRFGSGSSSINVNAGTYSVAGCTYIVNPEGTGGDYVCGPAGVTTAVTLTYQEVPNPATIRVRIEGVASGAGILTNMDYPNNATNPTFGLGTIQQTRTLVLPAGRYNITGNPVNAVVNGVNITARANIIGSQTNTLDFSVSPGETKEVIVNYAVRPGTLIVEIAGHPNASSQAGATIMGPVSGGFQGNNSNNAIQNTTTIPSGFIGNSINSEVTGYNTYTYSNVQPGGYVISPKAVPTQYQADPVTGVQMPRFIYQGHVDPSSQVVVGSGQTVRVRINYTEFDCGQKQCPKATYQFVVSGGDFLLYNLSLFSPKEANGYWDYAGDHCFRQVTHASNWVNGDFALKGAGTFTFRCVPGMLSFGVGSVVQNPNTRYTSGSLSTNNLNGILSPYFPHEAGVAGIGVLAAKPTFLRSETVSGQSRSCYRQNFTSSAFFRANTGPYDYYYENVFGQTYVRPLYDLAFPVRVKHESATGAVIYDGPIQRVNAHTVNAISSSSATTIDPANAPYGVVAGADEKVTFFINLTPSEWCQVPPPPPPGNDPPPTFNPNPTPPPTEVCAQRPDGTFSCWFGEFPSPPSSGGGSGSGGTTPPPPPPPPDPDPNDPGSGSPGNPSDTPPPCN